MINKNTHISNIEQVLNHKETIEKEFEEVDFIEQTVIQNLHLSTKKALTFAKQARALQHNLSLRKKQKAERESGQQINHYETSH